MTSGETSSVTGTTVAASPAGATVTFAAYAPGAASSGTCTPHQIACTVPRATGTGLRNLFPVQSTPPRLKQVAAVAGIAAPAGPRQSSNRTLRSVMGSVTA